MKPLVIKGYVTGKWIVAIPEKGLDCHPLRVVARWDDWNDAIRHAIVIGSEYNRTYDWSV